MLDPWKIEGFSFLCLLQVWVYLVCRRNNSMGIELVTNDLMGTLGNL
jgi:hypothetical protein